MIFSIVLCPLVSQASKATHFEKSEISLQDVRRAIGKVISQWTLGITRLALTDAAVEQDVCVIPKSRPMRQAPAA
jgi:hypothetical protein